MSEENWYWLGTNPIERQEHRVVLPHAVVDTDLIRVDSEIAWARDRTYDAVVVSGREEPFDDDRHERLGDTRIAEKPVLPIPAEVMERRGFERGDALHFATTDELGAAGHCLILSSDEADALLEDAQAMQGSVDAGHGMEGL